MLSNRRCLWLISNFILIFFDGHMLTSYWHCSRGLITNSFINCAWQCLHLTETVFWHSLQYASNCLLRAFNGILTKCLLTLFTAYVYWLLTLSRPVIYWQFKTVNCSLTLFTTYYQFFTGTFYDLLTAVYWHILRFTDNCILALFTVHINGLLLTTYWHC